MGCGSSTAVGDEVQAPAQNTPQWSEAKPAAAATASVARPAEIPSAANNNKPAETTTTVPTSRYDNSDLITQLPSSNQVVDVRTSGAEQKPQSAPPQNDASATNAATATASAAPATSASRYNNTDLPQTTSSQESVSQSNTSMKPVANKSVVQFDLGASLLAGIVRAADKEVIPDASADFPEPSERRWNDEFQRLFGRPVSTPADERLRSEQLQALVSAFQEYCVRVGTVLAQQRALAPSARLPPWNRADEGSTGHAGGEKYKWGEVLFKFARDDKQVHGNDDAAQKIACNELRAISAVQRVGIRSLHTSLSALVMIGGHVVIGTAMIDGLANDTIVYGSDDTGKTVHAQHPPLQAMLERVARTLHLRSHRVGNVSLLMAGDCEGHQSKDDGRLYLLDLGRFFPPLPMTRTTGSESATTSSLVETSLVFRPEFLRTHAGGLTLSPDALSQGWSRDDPDALQQREDFREAFQRLTQERCKHVGTQLLQQLMTSSDSPQVPVDVSRSLTTLAHEAGVNIALLGFVHQHVLADTRVENPAASNTVRNQLCTEMLLRSLRRIVRGVLRDARDTDKPRTNGPLWFTRVSDTLSAGAAEHAALLKACGQVLREWLTTSSLNDSESELEREEALIRAAHSKFVTPFPQLSQNAAWVSALHTDLKMSWHALRTICKDSTQAQALVNWLIAPSSRVMHVLSFPRADDAERQFVDEMAVRTQWWRAQQSLRLTGTSTPASSSVAAMQCVDSIIALLDLFALWSDQTNERAETLQRVYALAQHPVWTEFAENNTNLPTASPPQAAVDIFNGAASWPLDALRAFARVQLVLDPKSAREVMRPVLQKAVARVAIDENVLKFPLTAEPLIELHLCLADMAQNAAEWPTAEASASEALRVATAAKLGERVSMARQRLAMLKHDRGDETAAASLLVESLSEHIPPSERRRDINDIDAWLAQLPGNLSVADALVSLGRVLLGASTCVVLPQTRANVARACLERARVIRLEQLGAEHHDYGEVLMYLASAWRSSLLSMLLTKDSTIIVDAADSDVPGALKFARAAETIFKRSLSAEHRTLTSVQLLLAQLGDLGDTQAGRPSPSDETKALLQQCWQVTKQRDDTLTGEVLLACACVWHNDMTRSVDALRHSFVASERHLSSSPARNARVQEAVLALMLHVVYADGSAHATTRLRYMRALIKHRQDHGLYNIASASSASNVASGGIPSTWLNECIVRSREADQNLLLQLNMACNEDLRFNSVVSDLLSREDFVAQTGKRFASLNSTNQQQLNVSEQAVMAFAGGVAQFHSHKRQTVCADESLSKPAPKSLVVAPPIDATALSENPRPRGVFHAFGTAFGKRDVYSNTAYTIWSEYRMRAHSSGALSRAQFTSARNEELLAFSPHSVIIQDIPGGFIIMQLPKGFTLRLTHVALRASNISTHQPRHLALQACQEGATPQLPVLEHLWFPLHERRGLEWSAPHQWQCFAVAPVSESVSKVWPRGFNTFRVQMKGTSSSNSSVLAIGGLELFGELLYEEQHMTTLQAAAVQEQVNRAPITPAVLAQISASEELADKYSESMLEAALEAGRVGWDENVQQIRDADSQARNWERRRDELLASVWTEVSEVSTIEAETVFFEVEVADISIDSKSADGASPKLAIGWVNEPPRASDGNSSLSSGVWILSDGSVDDGFGHLRLQPLVLSSPWRSGDIIGVLYSPSEQRVSFFHNGRRIDVPTLQHTPSRCVHAAVAVHDWNSSSRAVLKPNFNEMYSPLLDECVDNRVVHHFLQPFRHCPVRRVHSPFHSAPANNMVFCEWHPSRSGSEDEAPSPSRWVVSNESKEIQEKVWRNERDLKSHLRFGSVHLSGDQPLPSRFALVSTMSFLSESRKGDLTVFNFQSGVQRAKLRSKSEADLVNELQLALNHTGAFGTKISIERSAELATKHNQAVQRIQQRWRKLWAIESECSGLSTVEDEQRFVSALESGTWDAQCGDLIKKHFVKHLDAEVVANAAVVFTSSDATVDEYVSMFNALDRVVKAGHTTRWNVECPQLVKAGARSLAEAERLMDRFEGNLQKALDAVAASLPKQASGSSSAVAAHIIDLQLGDASLSNSALPGLFDFLCTRVRDSHMSPTCSADSVGMVQLAARGLVSMFDSHANTFSTAHNSSLGLLSSCYDNSVSKGRVHDLAPFTFHGSIDRGMRSIDIVLKADLSITPTAFAFRAPLAVKQLYPVGMDQANDLKWQLYGFRGTVGDFQVEVAPNNFTEFYQKSKEADSKWILVGEGTLPEAVQEADWHHFALSANTGAPFTQLRFISQRPPNTFHPCPFDRIELFGKVQVNEQELGHALKAPQQPEVLQFMGRSGPSLVLDNFTDSFSWADVLPEGNIMPCNIFAVQRGMAPPFWLEAAFVARPGLAVDAAALVQFTVRNWRSSLFAEKDNQVQMLFGLAGVAVTPSTMRSIPLTMDGLFLSTTGLVYDRQQASFRSVFDQRILQRAMWERSSDDTLSFAFLCNWREGTVEVLVNGHSLGVLFRTLGTAVPMIPVVACQALLEADAKKQCTMPTALREAITHLNATATIHQVALPIKDEALAGLLRVDLQERRNVLENQQHFFECVSKWRCLSSAGTSLPPHVPLFHTAQPSSAAVWAGPVCEVCATTCYVGASLVRLPMPTLEDETFRQCSCPHALCAARVSTGLNTVEKPNPVVVCFERASVGHSSTMRVSDDGSEAWHDAEASLEGFALARTLQTFSPESHPDGIRIGVIIEELTYHREGRGAAGNMRPISVGLLPLNDVTRDLNRLPGDFMWNVQFNPYSESGLWYVGNNDVHLRHGDLFEFILAPGWESFMILINGELRCELTPFQFNRLDELCAAAPFALAVSCTIDASVRFKLCTRPPPPFVVRHPVTAAKCPKLHPLARREAAMWSQVRCTTCGIACTPTSLLSCVECSDWSLCGPCALLQSTAGHEYTAQMRTKLASLSPERKALRCPITKGNFNLQHCFAEPASGVSSTCLQCSRELDWTNVFEKPHSFCCCTPEGGWDYSGATRHYVCRDCTNAREEEKLRGCEAIAAAWTDKFTLEVAEEEKRKHVAQEKHAAACKAYQQARVAAMEATKSPSASSSASAEIKQNSESSGLVTKSEIHSVATSSSGAPATSSASVSQIVTTNVGVTSAASSSSLVSNPSVKLTPRPLPSSSEFSELTIYAEIHMPTSEGDFSHFNLGWLHPLFPHLQTLQLGSGFQYGSGSALLNTFSINSALARGNDESACVPSVTADYSNVAGAPSILTKDPKSLSGKTLTSPGMIAIGIGFDLLRRQVFTTLNGRVMSKWIDSAQFFPYHLGAYNVPANKEISIVWDPSRWKFQPPLRTIATRAFEASNALMRLFNGTTSDLTANVPSAVRKVSSGSDSSSEIRFTVMQDQTAFCTSRVSVPHPLTALIMYVRASLSGGTVGSDEASKLPLELKNSQSHPLHPILLRSTPLPVRCGLCRALVWEAVYECDVCATWICLGCTFEEDLLEHPRLQCSMGHQMLLYTESPPAARSCSECASEAAIKPHLPVFICHRCPPMTPSDHNTAIEPAEPSHVCCLLCAWHRLV